VTGAAAFNGTNLSIVIEVRRAGARLKSIIAGSFKPPLPDRSPLRARTVTSRGRESFISGDKIALTMMELAGELKG
jgi:hypothetical protein